MLTVKDDNGITLCYLTFETDSKRVEMTLRKGVLHCTVFVDDNGVIFNERFLANTLQNRVALCSALNIAVTETIDRIFELFFEEETCKLC